jgi:hypothetical protein
VRYLPKVNWGERSNRLYGLVDDVLAGLPFQSPHNRYRNPHDALDKHALLLG